MGGERGPELVNLPKGSQVIPNSRLGGMGATINNTINVQPTTTRETASQIARRVGEVSQRAMMRSN